MLGLLSMLLREHLLNVIINMWSVLRPITASDGHTICVFKALVQQKRLQMWSGYEISPDVAAISAVSWQKNRVMRDSPHILKEVLQVAAMFQLKLPDLTDKRSILI